MCRCLMLLLVLSGCSNTLQIDKDMQPYITRFEQDTGTQVIDLIASFGTTTSADEIAYCEMGSGKTPTIVFDRSYWDSFSDEMREQVMYHELGHCIYKRGHKEDKRPNNNRAPASIMYPTQFSQSVYKTYRQEYIQELKEGR